MSTPISSLKKTKRSPLHSPSKPNVDLNTQFRHPDFTDDQIQHLTENDSNIRFIRTMRPFRQSDRGLSLLETINCAAPSPDSAILREGDESLTSSDHELIALLMSRLVQLENRLADAQKQMIEKEKKIYKLEDKLRLLDKGKDGSAGMSHTELELQYKKLQQQISEMERFLNDYGMIWVGEKRSSSVSITSDSDSIGSKEERTNLKSDSFRSKKDSEKDFHIDYDLILGNIKELNILAGDGRSEVEISSSGGRLRSTEPIPLTLYANGLQMFSGPFRPFSDSSTRECIQDFMDGFYPSELQPLYPEGVPFHVTDKRHVVYRNLHVPFLGEGMALSGNTTQSNSESELKDCMLLNHGESPSSTRRFLQKMPKVVINRGKLFNIRDSIAQSLKGDKAQQTQNLLLVPTSASQTQDKLKNKVISIRLKSENGQDTYLLKMYHNDTIGSLCKYLDAYRSGNTNYEIISLCPYKVFNNKNATLKECGIAENVALYLRSFPLTTIITTSTTP